MPGTKSTDTVDPQAQESLALAAKMVDAMTPLAEEIPDLKSQIAKLAGAVEGMDAKAILADIERLKAAQEEIRDNIRSSKNPMAIPGLEDPKEAGKFSVTRACNGLKFGQGTKEGFESLGAGFEYEVMAEFRERGEKSGALAGLDGQGGFFVPDQVIPDVIESIYRRSVLINLNLADGTTRVQVINGLTGSPARIPKINGGMIAYWIGEEDEYAETRANTEQISLTPKKLGLLTVITDEMMKLGGFGFEQMLRRDMARAAAQKLDYTVLYGRGTNNEPIGVANMKSIQVYDASGGVGYNGIDAAVAGVADWANVECDFDDLMEMRGVIEDNDIPVSDDNTGSHAIISHPRFFRRRKQQKVDHYSGQASNQAYLLQMPFLRDSALREIIGDYDGTTAVPTTNNPGASIGGSTTNSDGQSGDVFSANWEEIVVGRWGALEILTDGGVGTGFTGDKTKLKLRMYADVAHRQPLAVVMCPNAQMRG